MCNTNIRAHAGPPTQPQPNNTSKMAHGGNSFHSLSRTQEPVYIGSGELGKCRETTRERFAIYRASKVRQTI